MSEDYRTVYKGGEGEIIEKKSRFIATVVPAATREEAEAFVLACKKKYWDAAHNCSAFVIGRRGDVAHASDDGEPGGTAGRPMLEVLLSEQVRNVCVVVTRYFGGILLGTGGLVRAYQSAAKEGLSHSVIIDKRHGIKTKVTIDYNDVGKIQYILSQKGIRTLDSLYEEKVGLTVLLPFDEAENCKASIVEATAGRAVMSEGEAVYFAKIGKETQVFPFF